MDDLISRQKAIDALKEKVFHNLSDEFYGAMQVLDELPSAQPEIICCKDCVYQTESWIGIKYCEAHGDHIGKDYDYCSNARRKENG